MRILISGGAGYLGSVLTPCLLSLGHKVRVVDSLMYGGESLLGCLGQENFEFIPGDIRKQDVCEQACHGTDAVIHLAAIVGDPACSRMPEMAKSINLDASLALFEASVQSGVQRFVFSSTCSNYGKMRDPGMPADEEAELRPVSLYAETKVAVEKKLLGHPKACPAPTILRFATLHGLSRRMRFDLTINEFAMELFTNRRLAIFGEQFWRPYVHITDVVAAITLVLNSPVERVCGQVFNVGSSDENYTKGQIVDVIRSLLDFPVEIERVHKNEDPRDYRVSFEKIKKTLGLNTRRRIGDGAREVIQAIHSNVFSDFRSPRYRN